MLKKFILAAIETLAIQTVACSAAEDPAANLSHFPFDLIEVKSDAAYAEWQRLNALGSGTPIIVGSYNDVVRLAEAFDPEHGFGDAPEVALAKADALTHPQSIRDLRDAEQKELLDWARDEGDDELIKMMMQDATLSPTIVGRWPDRAERNPGLLTLRDHTAGGRQDPIFIAVLPTGDPADAPAWLRLGGWNGHPPAEYHVAAFRAWRDRYGAVPVLITPDVIEMHASHGPETRKDAMKLAYEHFDYNEDTVTQGTGTIAALGASLQASEWWYFWWD